MLSRLNAIFFWGSCNLNNCKRIQEPTFSEHIFFYFLGFITFNSTNFRICQIRQHKPPMVVLSANDFKDTNQGRVLMTTKVWMEKLTLLGSLVTNRKKCLWNAFCWYQHIRL